MTMVRQSLAALLLGGVLASVSVPAIAQEDQTFNLQQKDAIRKVIHDYLMDNPEIIAEAVNALQTKENIAAENAAQKALVERKADIYNDSRSPVLGNPAGDVTVVAFLDYRCTYCKGTDEAMFEVIRADGKTRLIIKEMPILGAESVTAARVALAAQKQKKYETFHRELMRAKGGLSEAVVYRIAADVGLNVEQLRQDAEDEQIIRALKDTQQLAHALRISGTPAFIIGDQIIGGQMPVTAFKQVIEQARKMKPKS